MPKFNPSYLLKNKHIQTLYAPLFRKNLDLPLRQEVFELEDGDFVDCHWYQQPSKQSLIPIVVLFHGLEGSYRSPYIQGIMKTLGDKNYAVVLMHFRSCADTANRLPRCYHSGDTGDAKAWISHLAKTYPSSVLHAIGYSMGGNVLLKLLGEWGKETPLSSAISVSAPLQLDICASTMKKGFARIYQRHLLKHLKVTLLQKYTQHPMEKLLNQSPQEIKNIKTIWEFDEKYTAKIHNFGTAENYYLRSSAKQYLKNIPIPTLIIHALDDPFMTPQILPNKEELSPSIQLSLTPNGGHVGFVHGSLFKPRYWLEEKILSYIESVKS